MTLRHDYKRIYCRQLHHFPRSHPAHRWCARVQWQGELLSILSSCQVVKLSSCQVQITSSYHHHHHKWDDQHFQDGQAKQNLRYKTFLDSLKNDKQTFPDGQAALLAPPPTAPQPTSHCPLLSFKVKRYFWYFFAALCLFFWLTVCPLLSFKVKRYSDMEPYYPIDNHCLPYHHHHHRHHPYLIFVTNPTNMFV